MNLVKTISSEIDKLNRKVVKFLRLGKNDIQTSLEAGPYGVDSNPIKDMIAVYSPTQEMGKTVLVGYLNKNQLAAVGETRLFSTNEDGALQFYIWLKNNGTMEIGGDSDNMVRYSKLEEWCTEIQGDINNLKDILAEWIPTPNDGGLALKSLLTGTLPELPYYNHLSKDISQAKIEEIKTL